MLGRGIDQILRTPSNPRLFEPWVTDARDYVKLAEKVSGPIPRDVPEYYVWGDLLADLNSLSPDVRIVNLETAITKFDRAEEKGINYRMHPDNTGVLNASGIDACVLANNHVIDWGLGGLTETLEALRVHGICSAGAGMTEREAWAPCVIPVSDGRRVLLVACAAIDSGVPPHWAAGPENPGIAIVPDTPIACVNNVRENVLKLRRQGDILVVSIHWGGNWGFEVPSWHQKLAHALIETCRADIVFGHSSHHPKAVEFYRDGLILYGCGDLINDYEGISGHENFLPGTVLGYFVDFDQVGDRPVACLLRPFEICRFQLKRAGDARAASLANILSREYGRMNTPLAQEANGDFVVTAPLS